MDTDDYRNAVKKRFRITVNTFDDDIDDCVVDAINSIAPFVKKPSVETAFVTGSTQQITLPTPTADVERVYVSSDGVDYTSFPDYTVRNGVIYARADITDIISARLHTRKPYTIVDINEIPAAYYKAVTSQACSEFATLLAGDKSAYNIYAQSNGARAVDNMLDLSEFYESRAERLLNRLTSGEVAA